MRGTVLVLAILLLVGGYVPLVRQVRFQLGLTKLSALTGTLSDGGSAEDSQGSESSSSSSSVPFDLDFAEAMSKPLPEWYEAQKAERERLIKELQDNRDRIVKEFRAKYEVREEVKEMERKAKWSFLDSRDKERRKRKKGSSSDLEEETSDERTTREKWEKFWDEEEQTTGFYLPGFFEVFPELQLKWPNWAKKKGEAIECEKDEDCQFPQACCPHPIIPGDKFCCTGWTQRILVPAYARQVAATDHRTRDEAADDEARDAAERERSGRRPWEPND
jgi:hypothetical protein